MNTAINSNETFRILRTHWPANPNYHIRLTTGSHTRNPNGNGSILFRVGQTITLERTNGFDSSFWTLNSIEGRIDCTPEALLEAGIIGRTEPCPHCHSSNTEYMGNHGDLCCNQCLACGQMFAAGEQTYTAILSQGKQLLHTVQEKLPTMDKETYSQWRLNAIKELSRLNGGLNGQRISYYINSKEHRF